MRVRFLCLEGDGGVELNHRYVISWYFFDNIFAFVLVNSFNVLLEPFCLCFKVVVSDMNIPSSMRICFVGSINFDNIMVINQFGVEYFHGNRMYAVDGNGPDAVDESDLFFDSIVECSFTGVFPLILDESLIEEFTCCCKVFADFVISIAWTLDLVC